MNKRKFGSSTVSYGMVIGMLFIACKAKGPVVERREIDSKNKTTLLEEMKENEYHYNTIAAKASVSVYDHGKKSSIKANLHIRRDSAIWINFSYIGFAGARILITQDSVKVINYKESKYLVADLDYVNKLFEMDIDYETIESLITGNSSPFDEDDKLRTSLDNDQYFLSSVRKRRLKKGIPERRLDKLERKQEKNPERQRFIKKQERKEEKYGELVYSIWMDPGTRKILKTWIKDFFNDKELIAEYKDFRDADGQLFPYEATFQLNTLDSTNIKIDYSKVSKNKPVNFVFNIPDKYEPMAD